MKTWMRFPAGRSWPGIAAILGVRGLASVTHGWKLEGSAVMAKAGRDWGDLFEVTTV